MAVKNREDTKWCLVDPWQPIKAQGSLNGPSERNVIASVSFVLPKIGKMFYHDYQRATVETKLWSKTYHG